MDNVKPGPLGGRIALLSVSGKATLSSVAIKSRDRMIKMA